MTTLDDLGARPAPETAGDGDRQDGPSGSAGSSVRARPPMRRPPRRSKWRLLMLPLVVALLAVSVKLLTMSLWSRQGASAYDEGRYAAAESHFERTRLVNVVDPWKAWLGIGDARFRAGDLAGAEEAFATALEADPERCDVRFNLAVTIEASGDRMLGDRSEEVEDRERLEGLARYRVALDIVNAGICPVDELDGPGARLAETRERLEAKLGAEGSPQDESAMDDPDGNDAAGEENNTDSQQEAIEERNQTGAAERQDASDINPSEQQPPREPNW